MVLQVLKVEMTGGGLLPLGGGLLRCAGLLAGRLGLRLGGGIAGQIPVQPAALAAGVRGNGLQLLGVLQVLRRLLLREAYPR